MKSTNWDKLSMKNRTNYIKLALDEGVTDLSVIRDTYNKYAEGGPKIAEDNIDDVLSYIDADNRRNNILLHNEDGNLYDSNGNNYTQSYLDENNVPVITGNMPRDTIHINGNPVEELKDMGKSYIDIWVDRNILAPNNYDRNKVAEKLFYGLDPVGYQNPKERVERAMRGYKRELSRSISQERNPVYAQYLGLDKYLNDEGYLVHTRNLLPISKYKPQNGNSKEVYYSLKPYDDPLNDTNFIVALAARDAYGKNTFVNPDRNQIMGNYTSSFGEDENGKYLSYYDKWDLNPFKDILGDYDIAESTGIGHPVELYNRRYYTPEEVESLKYVRKKDYDETFRRVKRKIKLNTPPSYAYGGTLFEDKSSLNNNIDIKNN